MQFRPQLLSRLMALSLCFLSCPDPSPAVDGPGPFRQPSGTAKAVVALRPEHGYLDAKPDLSLADGKKNRTNYGVHDRRTTFSVGSENPVRISPPRSIPMVGELNWVYVVVV